MEPREGASEDKATWRVPERFTQPSMVSLGGEFGVKLVMSMMVRDPGDIIRSPRIEKVNQSSRQLNQNEFVCET